MGCLFLGEKGDLYAGGWGEGGIMRLKGDKAWRGVLDHEAAKPLPITLPRAPGDNHMLQWLAACKGGPATFTGFDAAAHSSEVYLPGIVALRLGRPIDWDGRAMKAKGVPEADPLTQALPDGLSTHKIPMRSFKIASLHLYPPVPSFAWRNGGDRRALATRVCAPRTM